MDSSPSHSMPLPEGTYQKVAAVLESLHSVRDAMTSEVSSGTIAAANHTKAAASKELEAGDQHRHGSSVPRWLGAMRRTGKFFAAADSKPSRILHNSDASHANSSSAGKDDSRPHLASENADHMEAWQGKKQQGVSLDLKLSLEQVISRRKEIVASVSSSLTRSARSSSTIHSVSHWSSEEPSPKNSLSNDMDTSTLDIDSHKPTDATNVTHASTDSSHAHEAQMEVRKLAELNPAFKDDLTCKLILDREKDPDWSGIPAVSTATEAIPKIESTLDIHFLEAVRQSTVAAKAAELRKQVVKNVRWRGVNLCNADFEDSDLSNSEFVDCDFTGASLRSCNLSKVSLHGSKLSGLKFADKTQWQGVDMSGVIFDGAQLARVDFSMCKLSGSSFVRCDLTEANLTGADCSECNFTESTLFHTKIGRTNFQRCLFRAADLAISENITRERSDKSSVQRHPRGRLFSASGVEIEGPSEEFVNYLNQVPQTSGAKAHPLMQCISGLRAEEMAIQSEARRDEKQQPAHLETRLQFACLNLSGCNLRNCSISGAGFIHCDFTDCVADWCDMSMCTFDTCTFYGANVSDSNFSGAILSGSDFTGCLGLTGKQLSTSHANKRDVNLSGLNLRDFSAIRNCFDGATLKGTDFTSSRFLYCSFIGSNLAGSDFSKCTMDKCEVRKTSLRECTLPPGVLASWHHDMTECVFDFTILSGSNLGDGGDPRKRRIFKGSSFVDTVLDDCNLTGCLFNSCDMTRASAKKSKVEGAQFSGATLAGSDFSDTDISSYQLSHVSPQMSCINLSNCNLNQFRPPEKANLNGACFKGCYMASVDFSNVVSLEYCVMSDASMMHCKFPPDSGNIAQVVLSGCNLMGAKLPENRLLFLTIAKNAANIRLDSHNLENFCFLRMNLDGATFRNCRLRNSSFDGCSAQGATFTRADLTSVEFLGCNLSRANLDMCSMSGIKLAGCNLTGATIPSATILDWDRNMQGINLSKVNLEGADFSNCDLSAAILFETSARNCKFRDCCLRLASLHRSKLTSCDFRGCIWEGCVVEGADLRNAALHGKEFSLISKNVSSLTICSVDLKGMILQGASLQNSNFSSCDLDKVDLSGSCLDNAALSFASIQFANLSKCSMKNCKLRGANISSSNLRSCNLTGCDLEGAVAFGTDFRDALLSNAVVRAMQLRGAMLSGTDVSKTDFSEVDSSNLIFRGSKGLGNVKQPDSLKRSQHSQSASQSRWSDSVSFEDALGTADGQVHQVSGNQSSTSSTGHPMSISSLSKTGLKEQRRPATAASFQSQHKTVVVSGSRNQLRTSDFGFGSSFGVPATNDPKLEQNPFSTWTDINARQELYVASKEGKGSETGSKMVDELLRQRRIAESSSSNRTALEGLLLIDDLRQTNSEQKSHGFIDNDPRQLRQVAARMSSSSKSRRPMSALARSLDLIE